MHFHYTVSPETMSVDVDSNWTYQSTNDHHKLFFVINAFTEMAIPFVLTYVLPDEDEDTEEGDHRKFIISFQIDSSSVVIDLRGNDIYEYVTNFLGNSFTIKSDVKVEDSNGYMMVTTYDRKNYVFHDGYNWIVRSFSNERYYITNLTLIYQPEIQMTMINMTINGSFSSQRTYESTRPMDAMADLICRINIDCLENNGMDEADEDEADDYDDTDEHHIDDDDL
ncbi:MAG: hypothetical protein WC284_12175 [Candidimonas sp.]